MTNIIVAIVLVAIIGLAIAYIIRAMKKGTKCIGCPYAGNCGKEECNCD